MTYHIECTYRYNQVPRQLYVVEEELYRPTNFRGPGGNKGSD